MSSTRARSFNTALKYTLCPPCYYQSMEQSYRSYRKISSLQKPLILLIVIFFFIISGIMIFIFNSFSTDVFSTGDQPIGSFGLLLFIPIIFIVFVLFSVAFFMKFSSTASKYASSQMDSIRRDKEVFYLEHDSTNTYSMNDIYCNQCGSRIQKSDLFCPNCGDTTKDEFTKF